MSSIATLTCAVGALALALPVAAGASALEGVHRAAGAADAAALAAADAASGWLHAEPCALAEEVAAAVGVTLVGCEIEEASGRVRLTVVMQTMLGTARARASAGPP